MTILLILLVLPEFFYFLNQDIDARAKNPFFDSLIDMANAHQRPLQTQSITPIISIICLVGARALGVIYIQHSTLYLRPRRVLRIAP